jgi:hypothetical protein
MTDATATIGLSSALSKTEKINEYLQQVIGKEQV